MTDVFDIQLPDGRIVGIQANSPQEAAQGARNLLAREKGRGDARNKVDATAQAFGQGATFGYGDEATAAVRAAAPGFSNWMMQQPQSAFGQTPDAQGFVTPTGGQSQTVSDAPTLGGRYEEELTRERAKAQQFHKDNPALATGANIAGGLATTAAAGMAGAPLAFPAAPSLGGNMVRVGAAGAGIGAVQGFGEGEGGFENRLMKGAVPGAAIGGALGAAMPVAGAVGRAALESGPGQWISRNMVAPVAQRVAGAVEGTPARSLSAAAPDGSPGVQGPLAQFAQSAADPAREGAIERLTVALQRSGMSREQIERRLREIGPEAMLADVDAQFRTQARNAYVMPGETRSHAEIVLGSREAGRPQRIVSAFEGEMAPPQTFQLKGEGQAFDQNLRAVGNRAYGAMEEAGLRQTPELMAIYENPSVAAAIDRVMATEQATRVGTNRAPASPIEIMHKVKQAIWDLGFDKETARPGPMASWYRDLGVEYMNRLKRANPALAQADREYGQAASLPEFFERGYNLLTTGRGEKALNASSGSLAESLAGADPLQRATTRAGMVNAARDEVSGRNSLARSLALAKDLDPRGSREIAARLGQSFEPGQAREIGRVGASEVTMDQTKRGVTGGPDTASKVADMFDNAGVRVSEGGPSLRWWETIKDIAARATAPNESVRNQIGRMTLTPEAERNAEILRLAFEQLRRRQSGRPLAAALAGSSGASIGAP